MLVISYFSRSEEQSSGDNGPAKLAKISHRCFEDSYFDSSKRRDACKLITVRD